MAQTSTLASLYEALTTGRITRREFLDRAGALGATASLALYLLQTPSAAAAAPAGKGSNPAAHPQAAADRPATGTDTQQRGAGGELKLLQWQAATLLAVHSSTGTKDTLAASLVTEPLLSYLPDATLIPTLAAEVPTVENGGLSQDLTSVTYKLRDDIVWSDGQPFTAADVVFTWQWIRDPANASTSAEIYAPITAAEALDERTVKLTFGKPNPAWYVPFTGSYLGGVYPAHVLSAGPDAYEAFRQNPIGTGPYVVDSFQEGDQVLYKINDRYREPNKPYFSTVNIKGGGDAASAAQAVLQTGDWDFAWNLQVEPQILDAMKDDGKGSVVSVPGSNVEFLFLNFADPNTEVEGQRAYYKQPHPFLTDKSVRQALAYGADRQTIAEQFYGEGANPTANILVGIPAYESPNTSWEFNVDKGTQALEAAGWTMNGDVREKDGVQLKLVYAASINPVRQKTQAVNKQNWEKMGFKVQLKQISASVFFDSSPGNDQNYNHFYTDLQMDTNGASTPYPTSFMAIWYAGKDAQNVAQKSNQWAGLNKSRYVNPEYDRLYEAALVETDPEKSAQLFIQMNDMLINDVVIIPLAQRPAEKFAVSNRLRVENVAGNPWEALYWNIANWNAAQ